MRKFILNVMATTGISLIVLSTVALCYQASWLRIDGVFQVLLVNLLIHFGIGFLGKIDYTYLLLEPVLQIGYMLAVVLVCGAVFDWYQNLPVWCLVLMTAVIYVTGLVLSAFSILGEVKSINQLLEQRKDR